jgi:hypothetical protein
MREELIKSLLLSLFFIQTFLSMKQREDIGHNREMNEKK